MTDDLSVIVDNETGGTTVDPVTGTIETPTPDGGVVVQLDADKPGEEQEGSDFYRNLADDLDSVKLGQIADDLVEAINADDRSREGYLETRSRGLDLVGLSLPEARGSVSDGSSPVEGMSTVNNPLLLEAILKGWASSVGEFLPAQGPVKIRDDGEQNAIDDVLAETLERDFNHYLTKVATEYYPDTSHMILWGPYFGGSGFKKVYRCPMRRRPVSESVDTKDLIVSDTMKDLASCERITHQIMMRPSVMKRMKLLGAYRKADLVQPTPDTSAVDHAVAEIQGTTAEKERPEDQPYTIWETQCELDLPEFAPGKFKNEKIPLPYLVTIDKDSREILSLRRDWREDDEECQRKQLYVKWPYVPGPGFYGTGLLNILGNATAAMTAAWREALDAGQFASFPGGLMAKLGGRQQTNVFRLSPGEFAPIETNGMPINQVAMGLPYKDVTPGLIAMMDKITAQAKEVGGTADIPSGEGIANTPVGTMLATIEQATKIMQAAHKGMHQAQSEEFDLLLGLFRENPDDFIRCISIKSKQAVQFWSPEKFLEAVKRTDLVPVSDPNVPSHIHRISKALALVQLASMPVFMPLMNPKEVLLRALQAIKEDPEGLVIDPPPQQDQPNPELMKAQAAQMTAQANMQKAMSAAVQTGQQEKLKQMELEFAQRKAEVDLAREMIIHEADQLKIARDQERMQIEQQQQQERDAHDREQARHKQLLDSSHFLHDAHMSQKQHDLDEYVARNPQKKAGFASGGAVVSTDFLLKELIDAFGRLAAAQSAPREIIRDSLGKPVGVRIVENSGSSTLQ